MPTSDMTTSLLWFLVSSLLLRCFTLQSVVFALSLSSDARKFLAHLRNDYIFYGITQDCRVFFIRPKNLDLFHEMRVNNTVDLCAPEYVKWHYYQPKDKFLLTRKVAGKNEFCALSVEKPAMQTLENTHKFDYSAYQVVNNNMYCVHLRTGNFSFECDSSFYGQNILYIVNIRAQKNKWEILPLEVLENAELKKHGRSGGVPQESWGLQDVSPNETMIEVDATQSKRYVARRGSNFLLEYPLTLSRRNWRPQRMITIEKLNGGPVRIWSFSIDNQMVLLSEVKKEPGRRDLTLIYGVSLNEPHRAVHLITLNYKIEINFWNISTLKEESRKSQHDHRRHPTAHTPYISSTYTVPTRKTKYHWTAPWTVTTSTARYRSTTSTTERSITTSTSAWMSKTQDLDRPLENEESEDVFNEITSAESDGKIEDTGVLASEVCDELTEGCKKDMPKLASSCKVSLIFMNYLSLLIVILISS